MTPSNPLCLPEKLISKHAPLKSEHEIYRIISYHIMYHQKLVRPPRSRCSAARYKMLLKCNKLQTGGRHDMPRPDLQRKRAAAALSQAGRAGPDQPIRAIQPAGRTRRPPTGCTRQTSDVRQHHRLMPAGRGIIRVK